MQQLLVNSQTDFSKLQNQTPLRSQFSAENSFSLQKKNFSDFVREAKTSYEKSSSDAGKTETSSSEKKFSNQPEKTENGTEKNVSFEEKTEKESTTERKFVDSADNEKSEVSETKLKIGKNETYFEADEKNIEFSEIMKNELAEDENNVEKSKFSAKNVKKSVSEKKSEKLKDGSEKELRNTDLRLENQDEKKVQLNENQIAAAGTFEKIQKFENAEEVQNPKLSDNEIGEIDFSDGSISKNSKTFALDKDGKIIVKDFRSENAENPTEKNAEKSEKTELQVSEIRYDGKNSAEITMDVANNVQQNLISSNDQTASANGSNFQSMLTNQIQQNASEIVRAGTIVLKDNDVGQIKLILHPESLGNVKIDLHLNEKIISGRIVVSSQEAFNAFKESAENLKQAFAQSGFDSSGLELSFANQNSGGNHNENNSQNAAAKFAMLKSFGELESDSDFSSGTNFDSEILSKSARNSVNIVA